MSRMQLRAAELRADTAVWARKAAAVARCFGRLVVQRAQQGDADAAAGLRRKLLESGSVRRLLSLVQRAFPCLIAEGALLEGSLGGGRARDKEARGAVRALASRLLPGPDELRAAEDALDWVEAADMALVVAFGAGRRLAESCAALQCVLRRRRRYGRAVAERQARRDAGDLPPVWAEAVRVHRTAELERAGLEGEQPRDSQRDGKATDEDEAGSSNPFLQGIQAEDGDDIGGVWAAAGAPGARGDRPGAPMAVGGVSSRVVDPLADLPSADSLWGWRFARTMVERQRRVAEAEAEENSRAGQGRRQPRPIRLQSPLGAGSVLGVSRSAMPSGFSIGGVSAGGAGPRARGAAYSAASVAVVGGKQSPVQWAVGLLVGQSQGQVGLPLAWGGGSPSRAAGHDAQFTTSASADLSRECADDAAPLLGLAAGVALAGAGPDAAARALLGLATREGILPTPAVVVQLLRAAVAAGRGDESLRLLRACRTVAAGLGATPVQEQALAHAPEVAAACLRALGSEGRAGDLVRFWESHQQHCRASAARAREQGQGALQGGGAAGMRAAGAFAAEDEDEE